MLKKARRFFDKIEDKVRGKLSHYPIIYGFIGAVGIILFWRGVWHLADLLATFLIHSAYSVTPAPDIAPYMHPIEWLDGVLSLSVGIVLLLMTGLFVSEFIGSEIIISGLRREKKLSEKTEQELEQELKEVQSETESLVVIKSELKHIEDDLDKIEKKV